MVLASSAEGGEWINWISIALIVAILIVCIRIYGRLVTRLVTGHGKVTTHLFGMPDYMVVTVLASWFGGLAVKGFLLPSKAPVISDDDILQSAILFGLIVGGIIGLLRMRQIAVIPLFGLNKLRAWRVLGTAGALILAAFPLVYGCNWLVQWVMGDKGEPQEIVEFFQNAAEQSDWWRVGGTAFMGVVIAPLAEEFIFRGYIYGVLRRALGIIPALVFSGVLFAAIHLSGAAFPSLFVLAICLTLAYEATGSLLVPMVMHAVFNAVTFGAIFFSLAP